MDERYQASADGTAGGAVADGADDRVVAGTVAAVVVEAPVDRGADSVWAGGVSGAQRWTAPEQR